MWAIFKVFIEFVINILSLPFLGFGFSWLRGVWDLGSVIRGGTRSPCMWRWSPDPRSAREVLELRFDSATQLRERTSSLGSCARPTAGLTTSSTRPEHVGKSTSPMTRPWPHSRFASELSPCPLCARQSSRARTGEPCGRASALELLLWEETGSQGCAGERAWAPGRDCGAAEATADPASTREACLARAGSDRKADARPQVCAHTQDPALWLGPSAQN